jgi:hypothetical protein
LFDADRVDTLLAMVFGTRAIEEQTMKLSNQPRPRLPVVDYSHAIRNAVSWLGDRYLLAAPIDIRSINRSPSPYFAEKGSWHERVRDGN